MYTYKKNILSKFLALLLKCDAIFLFLMLKKSLLNCFVSPMFLCFYVNKN